ncbi:hypothetical protein A3L04_07205 [Thermococcus chitonophagus]|uniref:Uncharacterized protein n=1 Tax=Thermococcus chitonophagus TaxID=54262 RepID=A0A2Z2N493_9EURY|nr:hypothetical protein [Thermococcus chitonophagus]ASJ16875.1 hypothetical protein A3L04_07205 [Thermococcus chitonophagus]
MLKLRRAQTSVEGLLLMSIIVLSVIIISLPYLRDSGEVLSLVQIRNSANFAASYLTNGVIVDKETYAPLNVIIENYTGSLGVKFSFLGLKVTTENSSEIEVLVKFSHNLNLTETTNSKIASLIGEFIKQSLISLSTVRTENGSIYIGGRLLVLNITVENGGSVIK